MSLELAFVREPICSEAPDQPLATRILPTELARPLVLVPLSTVIASAGLIFASIVRVGAFR